VHSVYFQPGEAQLNSALAYPGTKRADNGGRRVMTAGMWLGRDELTRGEVPRLRGSAGGDSVPESQHPSKTPAAACVTQQKTGFVLE
jgi:hypothetical protein